MTTYSLGEDRVVFVRTAENGKHEVVVKQLESDVKHIVLTPNR